MLIKEIYCIPSPAHMIIEDRAGNLFRVTASPFRPLNEADLTRIETPMSNEMYLMASHADKYDQAIKEHLMRQYDLTDCPLKYFRGKAKMTQKQLAEKSGVNSRQIQRVENGESDIGNVTARNLFALADALNVDPRELME